MSNSTRMDILKSCGRAIIGLIIYAFGSCLIIQGNIGVSPWVAFSMGISYKVPLSYGDVTTIVSFVIVGIDLLLRERIGLGTILDALIVGKMSDFFLWLGIIPRMENPLAGAAMLVAGMFVMCYAQYFYMSAELCCGPRDSLLVALGKRFPKVPIGYVNIGIMVTVLTVSLLLKGPIGLGTVIIAFGLGVVMQITFKLIRFEPRNMVHQDIIQSMRILMGKENPKP